METGIFNKNVEPKRVQPEVVDYIGHVAVVYIEGEQRYFMRDSEAGMIEIGESQVERVAQRREEVPAFDTLP